MAMKWTPWLIVAALAGCSHPARQVPAEPVAPEAYATLGCAQLAAAIERRTAQVETLRFQLDDQVERERLRFLAQSAYLGLPWLIERLRGEASAREALYARLKGELRALRAAQAAQACGPAEAGAPRPATPASATGRGTP